MRLKECLQSPEHFDPRTRTVRLDDTKTGKRVIPVGAIAAKLLTRPPFTVGANEASTLFAKLTKRLMIDGPTFHDARATALTHLARRVDVLTLAKVSGHKDIALLTMSKSIKHQVNRVFKRHQKTSHIWVCHRQWFTLFKL